MKTLSNKEFIELLKDCCDNGRINDKKFEDILSHHWPYKLVFKGGLRENY